MRFLILAVIVCCCTVAFSQVQQVDLIVHNAVVYTVDSAFTKAEALAVKGGKIIAVGSNKDILQNYAATKKTDAKGKAVYPGFIDAHSHFMGYSQSLFSVDLYDAKSTNELVARVQQFAAAYPGRHWITGGGWDQNKFPGKAFPTNEELNRLYPNTPVLLDRVDGHAALANAKALEIAGIQPDQKINGGEIETIGGKLTGILIDNAVGLVASKIPAPSIKDMEMALQAAAHNCFAQGLSTVSDCGLMYNAVQLIDSLQRAGKLAMRVYAMLSDDTANYNRFLQRGPYETDKLFVKGFKVYADGALGSRGACLLQPYNDKPGWYGFLLSPQSHFDSVAAILATTDFQMCTHAIGDSANRVILSIYNKYLHGKNDKRWRIEHAQIINPADFKLFGAASIVPSVQPTHATSDMYWAADRLGKERLQSEGYAFKQLLQQNGWLPLGTDFPVEDISPFKTFLAAVFRVDAKGYPSGGFQMENALTKEQAIRGMTIWAAKASFLENEIGSIEPGKKADFIILDKDLMQSTATSVLSTKVLATYVGGVKVYGE